MMARSLQFVDSKAGILDAVGSFNRELRPTGLSTEMLSGVRTLLRKTKYWVCVRASGEFGPSKFVGLQDFDIAAYLTFSKAQQSGPPEWKFNGNRTRENVECVLETSYRKDMGLADELEDWAESVLGVGALRGIDDAKWRFVVL